MLPRATAASVPPRDVRAAYLRPPTAVRRLLRRSGTHYCGHDRTEAPRRSCHACGCRPAVPATELRLRLSGVAKGANADPREITRRAIAAIGGIERFVKRAMMSSSSPTCARPYYPFECRHHQPKWSQPWFSSVSKPAPSASG